MAGNRDLLQYYNATHARRIYGTSSVKYVRFLKPWVVLRGPRSIIDYGCGQSILLEAMGAAPGTVLRRYDPAIPEFATPPAEQSDLLLSVDVLEHLEEGDVEAALSEMRAWAKEAIVVVDTAPAKHLLPDGRNAHLTIRPHGWWQEHVRRAFGVAEPVPVPRKSRAAFRTWIADAAELARYRRLRLIGDARHHLRRLFRTHKQAWKVSSTGPKPQR